MKRVLIIEDNAAIRENTAELLELNRFSVLTAENGQTGFELAKTNVPDIILCDMMMPTLPGDMFYRAVERMRPHLCSRFVFMTGHRNNQKVNEFIQAVRGTILTKPFHIDDLPELIAFVQVRLAIEAAKAA